MKNKSILDSLRNGDVSDNIDLSLCVGFDEEIKHFENLLSDVNNGRSIIKFLNGEYGSGKSFFLKIIEKLALENNFVVSYIKFKPNYQNGGLKFFYRDFVNGLKSANESSFEHILNNWLDSLKKSNEIDVYDEFDVEFFNQILHQELYKLNSCSLSFKAAIEKYNSYMNKDKFEEALTILSWLSGDSTLSSKYGEDIDVLGFIMSISSLLNHINYSGLVVLIDDIESIMMFNKYKRDCAYDYIKNVIENLNLNNYKSTFVIIAGTPEWFENEQKGVPAFESLDDMLKNGIYTNLNNLKKPILNLKGFDETNLKEIIYKLVIVHENAYNWKVFDKINSVLENIVSIYLRSAGLTGCKVTPRIFTRSFISVLDIIQQNQSFFDDSNKILELFGEQETSELSEEIYFEDIDEFDDNW